MKITALMSTLLLFSQITDAQHTFKTQQQRFERVEHAYKEKWTGLSYDMRAKDFREEPMMMINAYKAEGKLEIWLKNKSDKAYRLFRSYDFCAHSGTLGPKVREYDRQTPEGFYYLNAFNPQSSFHLSLRVNYPNEADLFRTGKNNKPGSDIYIHGNCVTVGCIPLSDEKIKEVYILAVEARNNGQQQIPVNLYPFRMTAANTRKYVALFPAQSVFWNNLQQGYDYFEQHKILPAIKVVKGHYHLM